MELTIICLKFCFQDKEENLFGENISEGSLMEPPVHHFTNTPAPLPNKASMLKWPPQTQAKSAKNYETRHLIQNTEPSSF